MQSFFQKVIFYLFIVCTASLEAQVSFKVGYSIGLTNPEVSNGIIERFNAKKTFYTDPLEEFNTLSGFALGIRLHNDLAAIELSWDNKYNRMYAEGNDPANNNVNDFREVFLRFGSYSLGVESFLGPVGIGGTIDLNRSSIRTRYTGQAKKRKVLGENGLSSHFFLSYNFEASDFTAFSVKPYIQIPWRGIDLYKFEEELNPEFAATADPGNYREKFLNYGIMVIFYNGN